MWSYHSWSQVFVHKYERNRESGGLLVQSAHSYPLTLPFLSILQFSLALGHTPRLPLWGSTSINNTRSAATPFPHCVRACACVICCLLAVHTKKSNMRTGTSLCSSAELCANASISEHIWEMFVSLWDCCYFCWVCIEVLWDDSS